MGNLGHRIFGLRRTLARFLFFVKGRDVRLSCAHVLGYLNQYSFIQLHFIAILDFIGGSPVVVTYKIALVIIDHDTFVELMIS